MNKLNLTLSQQELQQMNYEKETVRNVLISRAIYNESLEYKFPIEEEKNIDFLYETEELRYFVRKEVESKLMINENQIIDEYNKNKEYFDTNKISFKDAREMIKVELTKQQCLVLEQDYVTDLVKNMKDEISISKEKILYSNGNAETLKQILINNLLFEAANKVDFFNTNKENIEIIKQEIRMNFFVRSINSIDVTVTEEEVVKFYSENTKNYEGVETSVAYNQIYANLREDKINKNISKYIEKIATKYDIDKKVEEELKKVVIN